MMVMTLAVTMLTGVLAQAQTATTPPCGGGGAGRMLTAEQRVERQKVMQEYLAGLRAKKGNGTITQEEQAFLDRMEERGGLCVNGVPRGPRGGFGAQGQRGQGNGYGAGGFRHGWCGGAGWNTNCPLANPASGK